MKEEQKQQLQLIREVAFYLSGLREGKNTPLGDRHIEALFSIVPTHTAYVRSLESTKEKFDLTTIKEAFNAGFDSCSQYERGNGEIEDFEEWYNRELKKNEH